MANKSIVLALVLTALFCVAKSQLDSEERSFDPSLYASEITRLISNVNKDLKVSRSMLRQLQRAVMKYGSAFTDTVHTVKDFEKALKKIGDKIQDNSSQRRNKRQ